MFRSARGPQYRAMHWPILHFPEYILNMYLVSVPMLHVCILDLVRTKFITISLIKTC